jgi:hypothetical protein
MTVSSYFLHLGCDLAPDRERTADTGRICTGIFPIPNCGTVNQFIQ